MGENVCQIQTVPLSNALLIVVVVMVTREGMGQRRMLPDNHRHRLGLVGVEGMRQQDEAFYQTGERVKNQVISLYRPLLRTEKPMDVRNEWSGSIYHVDNSVSIEKVGACDAS